MVFGIVFCRRSMSQACSTFRARTGPQLHTKRKWVSKVSGDTTLTPLWVRKYNPMPRLTATRGQNNGVRKGTAD